MNKNVIKYIILILALILSSLKIHPCLNILSMYLVCLFISINLNAKKIFQYSIFLFAITIILKIILNVNNYYFKENFYENLENENNSENKITKKSNKIEDKTKIDEELKQDEELLKVDEKQFKELKEDKESKEDKKLEEDKELKIEDEVLIKNEIKEHINKNNLTKEEIDNLNFTESLDDKEENEKFKGNDLNLITPAQAQRELYRLVDTTTLLTKTMNELSPILNEGKNIMNTLEQLNITSKLQK